MFLLLHNAETQRDQGSIDLSEIANEIKSSGSIDTAKDKIMRLYALSEEKFQAIAFNFEVYQYLIQVLITKANETTVSIDLKNMLNNIFITSLAFFNQDDIPAKYVQISKLINFYNQLKKDDKHNIIPNEQVFQKELKPLLNNSCSNQTELDYILNNTPFTYTDFLRENIKINPTTEDKSENSASYDSALLMRYVTTQKDKVRSGPSPSPGPESTMGGLVIG